MSERLFRPEDNVGILVVDGDEAVASRMAVAFRQVSDAVDVTAVGSAESALATLATASYDTVVVGDDLPGMTAVSLLCRLRFECERDVPFVWFSGTASDDERLLALECGANRCLVRTESDHSACLVLAEAVMSEIERERTRAELVRTRDELRQIYDTVPVMITRKDTENRLLRVNDAVTEYLGMAREEIEGKTATELFPDYGEEYYQMDQYVIESGEPLTGVVQQIETPSGEERWLKTDEFPYRNEAGEVVGVLIVSEDITELKQVERELARQTEILQFALTSADGGVLNWDVDAGVLTFGADGARVLGYERAAFDGGVDSWLDLVHPDDREVAREAFAAALSVDGGPYDAEYRVQTAGGEYRWVLVRGDVMERDRHGEPERFSGIFLDVDDRKRAKEREAFLHSLLRHDLRNYLHVAGGYLGELDVEQLSETARSRVETARSAVDQGSDLIEKVTILDRLQDGPVEQTVVDLDEVLRGVVADASGRANGRGIEIDYQGATVRARAGELLSELFGNLVGNAIRHSGGSRVRLSVEPMGETVVCTVEDDGHGIEQADRERLFEKGFSTGPESGSGLGTFLAAEIARLYGGSVEVGESDLGGARFDVELEAA